MRAYVVAVRLADVLLARVCGDTVARYSSYPLVRRRVFFSVKKHVFDNNYTYDSTSFE